jgi:hypothetical protein
VGLALGVESVGFWETYLAAVAVVPFDVVGGVEADGGAEEVRLVMIECKGKVTMRGWSRAYHYIAGFKLLVLRPGHELGGCEGLPGRADVPAASIAQTRRRSRRGRDTQTR